MSQSPSISARLVARDALARILVSSADAQETITTHAGFSILSGRDRAFAHLLVMTTLRRLGQINALLTAYMARPLPKKLASVQAALQLGVVQLVWLATPPHAAVSETVDLVGQAHKGLVNAVLKRVATEGAADIATQDAAARLNTAPWLWQSWLAQWGEDIARNIATAHMQEPALDITPKENPELWAKELQGELLPTGSVRRKEASRISELPGYAEGAWWVQDAAASLPARLLGDVSGKTVFDLCAAPGGKTAQLAAAGARVIAVDVSERRLERLRENLTRLQLQADIVTADVTAWKPSATPEAILLDAPCSATGTLRRHPEGIWRKTQTEVQRMVALQRELLKRAIAWLPSGGTLVFCTCSLQQEEGEGQLEWLLKAREDIAFDPIRPAEVGNQKEFITPQGTLRTLPHYMGGMDGFFAARLKKR